MSGLSTPASALALKRPLVKLSIHPSALLVYQPPNQRLIVSRSAACQHLAPPTKPRCTGTLDSYLKRLLLFPRHASQHSSRTIALAVTL